MGGKVQLEEQTVEKWNTLEVKEGDGAKQEKTGGRRNHRLGCSRPSPKAPGGRSGPVWQIAPKLGSVGTYLPSGCPRRSAAAAGSGCRGWAARRPRTAGFLSRPGWARPSCRPCRSSGLWRRVLRSGPPYLRAFEQLYKKPNNREKKLHLFISAFRKSLVLYDTDNDSSACSSALHQMGLRTKKHDFGIRITSAQGLNSQMDSHAACYWQVLQLCAPESLSAHPPWNLCFCCGCLRLAVWDLFDLCPCEMATGKSTARKPALSDQGPQQQAMTTPCQKCFAYT